jgi:hypothetical protein
MRSRVENSEELFVFYCLRFFVHLAGLCLMMLNERKTVKKRNNNHENNHKADVKMINNRKVSPAIDSRSVRKSLSDALSNQLVRNYTMAC